MISHHCQSHSVSKHLTVLLNNMTDEVPKLFTFTINDAQPDHDAGKGHYSAYEAPLILLRSNPGYSFEAFECPTIVFARTIDGSQNRSISLKKTTFVHLR